MLGKLHTLQKEPPILCEETEFIFRGNDFSRRPLYAIELRVLRDARREYQCHERESRLFRAIKQRATRTRVPVSRARVSYLEQLNNSL